jgi:hypothetical protein
MTSQTSRRTARIPPLHRVDRLQAPADTGLMRLSPWAQRGDEGSMLSALAARPYQHAIQ